MSDGFDRIEKHTLDVGQLILAKSLTRVVSFSFVSCLCGGVLLFVCCVEMNEELSEAVERGDIESVTRLLDMQVDINGRDLFGVCVVSYNAGAYPGFLWGGFHININNIDLFILMSILLILITVFISISRLILILMV